MANIKRSLLFTVALVAVIAPVIESTLFSWSKDSGELRKKLALNVLETKEIKSILKSLYSNDKDAQIGELKVSYLVDEEKLLYSHVSRLFYKLSRTKYPPHKRLKEDCRRNIILKFFKDVMSSNLNTVLNVCKFVNSEWMSYCEDNIKQVHRDEQQLRQLGAKELEPEQVSEILDSIGDKKNVMFRQTSVESLLDQSLHFEVEDCQPDAIDARDSYLEHDNPILVSNLRNFDKALDPLFSFCAQNIQKVFEVSTASITDTVQTRIKRALPSGSAHDWHRARQWDHFELTMKIKDDEIEDSCRELSKSVANVMHIKRRAEKSLPESLDELFGNEWTELNNKCNYYLECYVSYRDNESKITRFCDKKESSLNFY